MSEIIVIAHNLRSTHNVGSIFRTCDGMGVAQLWLTGYTPYPKTPDDTRLPHISEKITKQINKTALGAEGSVPFSYAEEIPFRRLCEDGYEIVGLEQASHSVLLNEYVPPSKVALILGEEVGGLTSEIIEHCDTILEIPMKGVKESYNVSVAAAMALYGLIYNS